MFSVPSQPVENLGKVCENSRAVKNPRLRLGFSLICSRILPNVRLDYEGTENMFYFLNEEQPTSPNPMAMTFSTRIPSFIFWLYKLLTAGLNFGKSSSGHGCDKNGKQKIIICLKVSSYGQLFRLFLGRISPNSCKLLLTFRLTFTYGKFKVGDVWLLN